MNDTYFYLPETKSDKLVPVQVFDSGVSYNPNNQKLPAIMECFSRQQV